MTKAEALAAKITAKAEETISGLEREMALMQWPQEFRAIMWSAVALHATLREQEARSAHEADTDHDGKAHR